MTSLTVSVQRRFVDLVIDDVGPEDETVVAVLTRVVVEVVERDDVGATGHKT